MSAAEGALVLPARLDAAAAGALWRELSRGPVPAALDLAAVDALDSAGVALVLELVERGRRESGVAPALRNAPKRFADLCAAHRIDAGA